ncbi:hypothetical protein GGX14DRAFT_631921, partial [Mycena pura]
MLSSALALAILAVAAQVASQSSTSLAPAQITHVITVANNISATNGSAVFTPQVVNASLGETVLLNFTAGTHSAIQSTFAVPCVPAHETNITINGFDTGLRPANNGTSVTQFRIIMNADIADEPLWFYDAATCGIGGVGAINVGNASASLQPFDAFVRNAIRLNGTAATSSSIASATSTGAVAVASPSSSSGSGSDSGSGSNAAQALGVPTPAISLLFLLVLVSL